MTRVLTTRGQPPESAASTADPSPRPRRRRRRWVSALVAVIGLVLAYAGVNAGASSSGTGDDAPVGIVTDTATVASRTLAQTLSLDGALTYAGTGELAGGRTGTVTALPAVGTTVTAGQELWRIDDVPVPLMTGALPQWRKFEPSMTNGEDVKQLEDNLRRLGHDPNGRMTVDNDFTAATTAAVKRWQKSVGQAQTGTIDVGAVVFSPTDVRVTEHVAAVGTQANPGATILKVSQTRRVVLVDLDARRQGLVQSGSAVEVELPDGRTVPGSITSIGSVATQAGDSPPTVEMTVEFEAAADLPPLDQAPVEVLVSIASKTALAVPVKALLALVEGGYAVESVQGQRRELLAVETGMFADGYVEISGEGVREGMTVTVPR